HHLPNSANGGPAPSRPLSKPGGDPLAGALVYRARLEKLPTPPRTPVGWVRIRARTGWIARAKLEIVPKLVPVEPRPSCLHPSGLCPLYRRSHLLPHSPVQTES